MAPSAGQRQKSIFYSVFNGNLERGDEPINLVFSHIWSSQFEQEVGCQSDIQANMDGVVVKEEPLDLDDQSEDGLYSEADEQGKLRSEIWPKRRGLGCVAPRNLGQAFWSSLYRFEQKKWREVARKFLPGCSQPQPAMQGWCLTKQSLISAQLCMLHRKWKETKQQQGTAVSGNMCVKL